MFRRARVRRAALAVLAAAILVSVAFLAVASAATTRTVCATGCTYTTIQAAVDAADPGDTIDVQAGTYVEDVLVSKQLTFQGAGPANTIISGAKGGDTATMHVTTTGVVIDGFGITREGNNTTDWNDATLNSVGVAVQGQTAAVEVRNSRFFGNRTGIDINNSNGNSVHNNVIEDNRTGMIFRNQTDSTSVTQNRIANNWTAGVLFLDASSPPGSNSPVQSAANSDFSNNEISGNWYGGIVDRQSGGSIPPPPANAKNFSANWFGTQTPVVTTNNTTEPAYSAQIPVEFGGTATPPGNAPDIAGPASGNFDYTPLLRAGTDTAATPGFQGDFSDLTATAAGAQTGSTGRLEEAVTRGTVAGTVHALAGTYSETDTISKQTHLVGAGNSTVIDPPANGPALSIAAGGTQADPLLVSSLRTSGSAGGGNTGSGIAITSTVGDVTVSHVRSADNTGHGLAVNTAGSVTRLRLDSVDFSSNDGDGLRFPTSMTGLDGLTVVNSHFDLNGFAGMEILGPPSTDPVTNVTFTDSSFDRNDTKGIYVERLSNALFNRISVDQSGTVGGFAAGIDMNLKKQAFANVEIRDSRITNSGTGDSVNGVGITVKARDDGGNGPTTLAGVTLDGNTITGNQLGLRLGEPGKNNPGPTGVHVNRNNISGNVNGNGMTNVSQTTADATCNWWGSASGPSGQGPGSGDSVGTGITFSPFLQSSDLAAACHPPVAVADTGTTAEDTPLVVAAPGVLSNDSDPESRPLTAIKVSDPSHGTVSLGSNGGYTYTPTAGYNGPDSFTYKANNGTFDSNVVTVSITVTGVNDAPVAVNDAGTVAEDGTLTRSAATGVLSNDTDLENQALTATKVSDPSHGTVALGSDGSYTYTPTANYNGPDSFTYKANDGSADSNVATVAITVTPVSDAPVAADDSASVRQDGTLSAAAPGVLANDSDADGQSLTATKVSDPSHGTLTLRSNGSYDYEPTAGYNGPDSFTYKASDGTSDSNVATVSITVTPVAGNPGGPPEDTTAPVFVALKMTNTTFRVNAAGPSETVVVARVAKKGTAFVYSLSEAARVLFTIESRQSGRKVGATCRKPTKSNRKRPRCTRFVNVGSFAQNAKAGSNRKTFSGKIGTKTLAPGRYRATLRATDAAGNRSSLERVSFRIVRR